MHLKCPSGHSRWKHGLQTMSIFATRASGDSGGVYVGTRRAEQRDQRPADGRRRVHQAGIVADDDAGEWTADRSPCRGRCGRQTSRTSANRARRSGLRRRRSLGEPTSQTAYPDRRSAAPASAKCSAGQRLAGPNSAPGHRIATGRCVLRPSARIASARVARDRARAPEPRRRRHELARLRRERHEAVDQARQRLLSRRRASVSRHAARFAARSRCGAECAPSTGSAPTSTNSAARARACSRCREACAPARDARASRNSPWPIGFSMMLRDAAHARIDRRAPRRRENVDGRLLAAARAGARSAARTGSRRRSTTARRSGCVQPWCRSRRDRSRRRHTIAPMNSLSVRVAAGPSGGTACRNTDTSPRRSRRRRERRADGSTTAASPDSGNTAAGLPP